MSPTFVRNSKSSRPPPVQPNWLRRYAHFEKTWKKKMRKENYNLHTYETFSFTFVYHFFSFICLQHVSSYDKNSMKLNEENRISMRSVHVVEWLLLFYVFSVQIEPTKSTNENLTLFAASVPSNGYTIRLHHQELYRLHHQELYEQWLMFIISAMPAKWQVSFWPQVAVAIPPTSFQLLGWKRNFQWIALLKQSRSNQHCCVSEFEWKTRNDVGGTEESEENNEPYDGWTLTIRKQRTCCFFRELRRSYHIYRKST